MPENVSIKGNALSLNSRQVEVWNHDIDHLRRPSSVSSLLCYSAKLVSTMKHTFFLVEWCVGVIGNPKL